MKILSAIILLLAFVAKAADTNAPPALVPAYGEIKATFWEQHQVIIVVGVILFLIAQFFTLYRVLARVPIRTESPESQAQTALAGVCWKSQRTADFSATFPGFCGAISAGDSRCLAKRRPRQNSSSALRHNGKIQPCLRGEKVSSFFARVRCTEIFTKLKPPDETGRKVAQALDLVNEAEQWQSAQNPGNA